MALTKPAGCFLQLVSIPVFLWGMMLVYTGFGPGPDASLGAGIFGVLVIVGAAALLAVGRKPAQ